MDARTLMRADAVFEAALGSVLVVGGATGGLGSNDFPAPVDTAIIVVVGALLLLLAVALWRAAVSLTALAVGNLVTAGAALVWLLAATGFSTAGGLLVGVAIVGLAALCVLQSRSVRTSARATGVA